MNRPSMFVTIALALACSPPSQPVQDPVSSSPAVVSEAELEPPKPEFEVLDPEPAFVLVFEALRAGDWSAFQRFAGAPELRYYRMQVVRYLQEDEYGLGRDVRFVEDRTITPEGAEAWLAEIHATWAMTCAERPEPPCRSYPLSLEVVDTSELEDSPSEVQVDCGDPESGVLCCHHEAPFGPAPPILVDVCFDDAQRVTQVWVLDG